MASLVLQQVPKKARRILLIIGSQGLTYAEGSSTKLREALNAGALSVPEFLAYFGDQSSNFKLIEIPYERIQHFRIRLSDGAVLCNVVDESGQLLRIKTAIEDPELRGQAIVLLTENLTQSGLHGFEKSETIWRYAGWDLLFATAIPLASGLLMATQINGLGIQLLTLERLLNAFPKKIRGVVVVLALAVQPLGFFGMLAITIVLVACYAIYLKYLISNLPRVMFFERGAKYATQTSRIIT